MNKFTKWLELNWPIILSFFLGIWTLSVSVLFFSWLYGYWHNGLLTGKFEIASCWQGLSIIITSFMTIFSMVISMVVKHWIDSKFNSISGSPPANFFVSPSINTQTDRESG